VRTGFVGLAAAAAAAVLLATLTGCSGSVGPRTDGRILAIGAENQYTSVIAQIGGRYVDAVSILSDPNTDPHTFEASAQVATEISGAGLVVQNGLGYDAFMSKLEAASPSSSRVVISAQHVLGLPDSTRNPHLWYKPSTMPAVGKSIASALGRLQPAHRSYFARNLAKFDRSLDALTSALAAFRTAHPGVSVATTEPVADYLLTAAGADIRTPWALQAAIMNDTDPAPQDVATQDSLLKDRKVSVFVYNVQVTDSITEAYLTLARSSKIPVVGVYETMPTDGYDYQDWMLAELKALDGAVTSGKSTTRL
jgi:zinc/manganese transport system substrate-binding protein